MTLRQTTVSVMIVAILATTQVSRADVPASGTATPSVVEQTRAHHRRGLELFDAGDFKLALFELERAYEISHSPKVLYNIGQVHLQLRNFAEAEKALTRYLAEGEPSAERVAAVNADLALVRQRTAHLTVVVNVPGATVRANEVLLGTTPLSSRQLIDAGRVKVTVTREGYLPAERFVSLTGGEDGQLDIKLSALPSTAARPADSAPAEHDNYVPAIIGWIATGVLASAAVGTGLTAQSYNREAEGLRGQTVDSAPETEKAALDDARSRSKTYALATDILGGAAILAAGVSLYLTLKPPTRSSIASVKLRPNGYGLLFDGTFR